jgi:ankyrin repeat protein
MTLLDSTRRLGIKNFQAVLTAYQNLEERCPRGRTSLFHAARLGRIQHLQLLLGKGADPDARDFTDEAPLQAAARYGKDDCLGLLLEFGADLNHCPSPEKSEYSETALCSAVRKAPHLVDELLQAGADPNRATSALRFPLYFAAQSDSASTLIPKLIKCGADIDARNETGATALHAAIEDGSVSTVKLLVSLGANPHIQCTHRGTALCAAALDFEGKCVDLILALLPAKPSFSAIIPGWDMTPMEYAREEGFSEVYEVLKAAGGRLPKPPPDPDALPAPIEGNYEGTKVEITWELGSSAPDPEEIALAEEILGKEPTLLKRFGWRASPAHWTILSSLQSSSKPLSLARIAYFVRGYFNVPAGQELNDGPDFLGESYLSAISRFQEENLVESVDVEEAVSLSLSSSELLALLRHSQLPATGNKLVLGERLKSHFGKEEIKTLAGFSEFFRITEEGKQAILEKEKSISQVSCQGRIELYNILCDDEFVWACHLARDLRFLSDQYGSRTVRALAMDMERAKFLLNTEFSAPLIPPEIPEMKIRQIAAAVELSGRSFDRWEDWDSSITSPHDLDGNVIKPSQIHDLLGTWDETEF